MTSRSDPLAGPRAGASLLEMLVVLAILAGLAAMAAGALRGPSPGLLARQAAAGIMRDAALARLDAVRSGRAVVLDIPDAACDGPGPVALRFHPDGSADPARLCPRPREATLVLRADPLTGLLHAGDAS